ncbi:MAG: hypothetical protein M1831_006803 [Alyxoria varia]|nr:MAG: hypothetical protein M1831_006803 [Alyxoria varia]
MGSTKFAARTGHHRNVESGGSGIEKPKNRKIEGKGGIRTWSVWQDLLPPGGAAGKRPNVDEVGRVCVEGAVNAPQQDAQFSNRARTPGTEDGERTSQVRKRARTLDLNENVREADEIDKTGDNSRSPSDDRNNDPVPMRAPKRPRKQRRLLSTKQILMREEAASHQTPSGRCDGSSRGRYCREGDSYRLRYPDMDRRAARAASSHQSRSPSSSPSTSTSSSCSNPYDAQVVYKPAPRNPLDWDAHPTARADGRLTGLERSRRRWLDLCAVCGSSSHRKPECPFHDPSYDQWVKDTRPLKKRKRPPFRPGVGWGSSWSPQSSANRPNGFEAMEWERNEGTHAIIDDPVPMDFNVIWPVSRPHGQSQLPSANTAFMYTSGDGGAKQKDTLDLPVRAEPYETWPVRRMYGSNLPPELEEPASTFTWGEHVGSGDRVDERVCGDVAVDGEIGEERMVRGSVRPSWDVREEWYEDDRQEIEW